MCSKISIVSQNNLVLFCFLLIHIYISVNQISPYCFAHESNFQTGDHGNFTLWLGYYCNCNYDNLYSTIGGKPLLGCFTRMFTVSAISNAQDYRSGTVSTVFESRKGFNFPNSCRKTSDLKGPIAYFSLGSRHENIRWVWWPQPWPVAVGLILSAK